MVASSPVRHDSVAAPIEVYQQPAPWKSLSDFASHSSDIDGNAPFQQLVSTFFLLFLSFFNSFSLGQFYSEFLLVPSLFSIPLCFHSPSFTSSSSRINGSNSRKCARRRHQSHTGHYGALSNYNNN